MRKPWQLIGIVAMCTLIAACSGTRLAYKTAEGLEEQAYVVGEHYYALVREANDLRRSGALSGSTLERAQDLVQATRPVILELQDAAQAYTAVKSAQNEAELEAALNAAAIAVSRLVDVIKGVRTSDTWQPPDELELALAA